MGFNIKPKIDRYAPYQLTKGWGIMDMKTGEILKQKGTKHRIERYRSKQWAIKRCKELNNKED